MRLDDRVPDLADDDAVLGALQEERADPPLAADRRAPDPSKPITALVGKALPV